MLGLGEEAVCTHSQACMGFFFFFKFFLNFSFSHQEDWVSQTTRIE